MMTCLLFLLLCSPPSVAPANPVTASLDTQLEVVLTEGQWVYDVRLGRVAIESRTLTFCGEGRVHERIMDDTGVHDSSGAWALERSADGDILVISGEKLRDRGRFAITDSQNEKAIYLRFESGGRTLRFQGQRGGSPSPCATPN